MILCTAPVEMLEMDYLHWGGLCLSCYSILLAMYAQ